MTVFSSAMNTRMWNPDPNALMDRMALIAIVLMKVDLPEAFEPVKRIDFIVVIEFGTALSISG